MDRRQENTEPRRTPRVSSELSERYRYSAGVHGETSASMKGISASCVAWDRLVIQGLEQGRKARANPLLSPLVELCLKNKQQKA